MFENLTDDWQFKHKTGTISFYQLFAYSIIIAYQPSTLVDQSTVIMLIYFLNSSPPLAVKNQLYKFNFVIFLLF